MRPSVGPLLRSFPRKRESRFSQSPARCSGSPPSRGRAGLWLALASLALLAVDTPSHAQDFFAGKTISLSTHSTAGAGYDTYLRLLSRHMGKHIPGKPGFIVLNQPGAGGLTAVNYAARVAPQDGTFLTIVSQGLLVIEATGRKGLQTSLGAFKWLGNLSQSNNVTVT